MKKEIRIKGFTYLIIGITIGNLLIPQTYPIIGAIIITTQGFILFTKPNLLIKAYQINLWAFSTLQTLWDLISIILIFQSGETLYLYPILIVILIFSYMDLLWQNLNNFTIKITEG